jgi:hypothetical protein
VTLGNLSRPERILELGVVLESLAICGAVEANSTVAAWISSVGAAHPDKTGEWLCTDRDWLRHVLPAVGRLDLLRRTAIRDPLYRFHLDTIVAEVVGLIGKSARWHRLDELLFGPLLQFSPRLVQLLEISGVHGADDIADLWRSFRMDRELSEQSTFAEWDRQLWSDTPGGPAALFPLIVELYIPLGGNPVNVHAALHSLSERSASLLAAVIQCAQEGECYLLASELEPELNTFYNLGLPIRCWNPESSSADRRVRVGLVSPVRLLWGGKPCTPCEGTTVIPTVTKELTQSKLQDPTDVACYPPSADFWSCRNSTSRVVAFAGFPLEKGWPGESEEVPLAVLVPPARAFDGIALSRRRSPDVDGALQNLARHLLYGPLLQVLLLEALDRELGQETLAFLHFGTSDEKRGTEVRVFYRPAHEFSNPEERGGLSAYELGDFEYVMESLAQVVGIEGAGVLFATRQSRFWTSALLALVQIGVVSTDSANRRWSISLEALDRLHGGELMSRVIRNGQRTRDAFRLCLNRIWGELDTARRRGELLHAE